MGDGRDSSRASHARWKETDVVDRLEEMVQLGRRGQALFAPLRDQLLELVQILIGLFKFESFPLVEMCAGDRKEGGRVSVHLEQEWEAAPSAGGRVTDPTDSCHSRQGKRAVRLTA